MGNSDGMTEAMQKRGTNQVVDFTGGYFSFAFGNEIALVLGGEFYILNCGSELFEEVNKNISKDTTKEEAVSFWKEKSKDYEANYWSSDFSEI